MWKVLSIEATNPSEMFSSKENWENHTLQMEPNWHYFPCLGGKPSRFETVDTAIRAQPGLHRLPPAVQGWAVTISLFWQFNDLPGLKVCGKL